MYKIYSLLLLMFLFVACSTQQSKTSSKILQSIPVELTTHLGDQQTFTEGDEIQFLLSLGSDAYIFMYYVDANKEITQLLPNKNQQSNFYNAGYFLTIPEYDNSYRFIINKPFGKESLWVFASDQSIVINASYNDIKKYQQLVKLGSKKKFGEYLLQINTVEK